MRLSADSQGIERAAQLLRAGQLVAFPTETVYGLGARADDDAAVSRIYAAKGRPADNPTIVHVASAEAAFSLVDAPSETARALAAAFWPGPLTLVLGAREGATSAVARAGGATLALRVPAHAVAQALLRRVALPIAAPSANRSTAISPTTAAHVEKSLGRGVVVLDGGATGFGIESTIVDATHAGAPMRAPGAMARHYAPRVPLALVADLGDASLHPGTGYLLLGAEAPPPGGGPIERLPADPAAYAAGLYAALHRLEDSGAQRIVVLRPPETPPWAAVNDRLRRASAR